jgi:hypothetical protein
MMEIAVEIGKDEHQSLIKKYYLERNWTKRIAVLAIIAAIVSVLLWLPVKAGWTYLWEYFIFFSIALILLFFVLPYVALYIQMSTKLKKANNEQAKWLFTIRDNGVQIDDEQSSKFLSWINLNSVIVPDDFIVFRPAGNRLYFLPLSACAGDDSAKLLQLIKGYTKKPENKRPNPTPLYFVGLICLVPFLGGIVGLAFLILGITQYKDKILIGIGAAGLLITGFYLYNIVKVSNEQTAYEKLDPQTISHVAPDDYLQLFDNSHKPVLLDNFNSKLRAPIAEFSFKEFHYLIYKVDSLRGSDIHLDKIIKETYNDTRDNYGSYRGIVEYSDPPDIYVKMGKPDNFGQIYLNLFGSNTRTIMKNDSIAYYFSDFKNFFIKYKPSGGEEFFGKASKKDDDDARIPLELMFLKRTNNLYFILMYGNDKKTVLPAGTLYSFMTKAH